MHKDNLNYAWTLNYFKVILINYKRFLLWVVSKFACYHEFNTKIWFKKIRHFNITIWFKKIRLGCQFLPSNLIDGRNFLFFLFFKQNDRLSSFLVKSIWGRLCVVVDRVEVASL